jgi:Ca2+-binding EF-hand superfamily protein
MDKNSTGLTTKQDFEKSLKNVGMVLSRDDFNAMVAHYSENQGFDYMKLRGDLVIPMNPRRAGMTLRCFQIMDRSGSGRISFDDIRAFLCAKDHIEVISGVKTEKEIVDEFLDHFQGAASNNDGFISQTEFID